jgi:hypothetical protein
MPGNLPTTLAPIRVERVRLGQDLFGRLGRGGSVRVPPGLGHGEDRRGELRRHELDRASSRVRVCSATTAGRVGLLARRVVRPSRLCATGHEALAGRRGGGRCEVVDLATHLARQDILDSLVRAPTTEGPGIRGGRGEQVGPGMRTGGAVQQGTAMHADSLIVRRA